MKNNSKFMKNIERFGERYCLRYLSIWDKEALENNWWVALEFFLNHSFMRGRRDKLSNEYYYFTIENLKNYFFTNDESLDEVYNKLERQKLYFDKKDILDFKKKNNIGRKNSIKNQSFKKEIAEKNPIVKLLVTKKEIKIKWDSKTYKKKVFLGNDEDVMMVLDVLKFILDNKKKNIYKYIKNKIKNKKLETAYKELTKIRAVGDKIATFIIRDVGLMDPELKVAYEDSRWAFPVDTWVIKIAHELGCSVGDTEEIKKDLIKKCENSKIEPLKFAAGLWFLGFHSLDILLDILMEN